jgi:flagellar biogenesis protein FliO
LVDIKGFDKMKGYFLKKYYLIFFILIILNIIFSLGFNFQPDLEKIKQYDYNGNSGEGTGFSSSLLLQIFFFIILLVTIIFITFLINKIVGRRKLSPFNKSEFLEVVDILNLGLNHRICMIKVFDQIVLLGVSEKNINYLMELSQSNAEKIKEIQDLQNQTENFKSYLNNLNKIFGKKNYSKTTSIKDNLDRIRKIKQTRSNMGEDEIEMDEKD